MSNVTINRGDHDYLTFSNSNASGISFLEINSIRGIQADNNTIFDGARFINKSNDGQMNTTIIESRFENVSFKNAVFAQVIFVNSIMRHCNMENIQAARLKFDNTELTDISFRNSRLYNLWICNRGCLGDQLDFSKAHIHASCFIGNRIRHLYDAHIDELREDLDTSLVVDCLYYGFWPLQKTLYTIMEACDVRDLGFINSFMRNINFKDASLTNSYINYVFFNGWEIQKKNKDQFIIPEVAQVANVENTIFEICLFFSGKFSELLETLAYKDFLRSKNAKVFGEIDPKYKDFWKEQNGKFAQFLQCVFWVGINKFFSLLLL